MVLRLADHWVWDFWHVADDDIHHLFFLKAPRSLGDPDRRHWHPAIGHAMSPDLTEWTLLPDALAPSTAPAWDDFTTWTGSVVGHAGSWHLFYTGTSHGEDGLVQRVGHARSRDLVSWERVGDRPAFELDARWYETLDLAQWHDQAWRDPFVFRHGETWRALVTARCPTGATGRRGTIGHAASADLDTWTVQPPLSDGSPHGQLEIPEVREIAGRWYLMYSTLAPDGGPGTFAAPSTGGPLGPWDWTRAWQLVGDGWYGAKLIARAPGAELVALAWRDREPGGDFGGWISDPMPVTVDPDGFQIHPPDGSAAGSAR